MSEVKHFAAPVMHVRVAPQKRKSQSMVEVVWNNLVYTPRTRSLFNFNNNVENTSKTILNGLSGSFRSGQLVAMMGPSGSGKTSLLESIAGTRTIGLSGSITMTGKDRLKIGFVAQFDHHIEYLTVKESLVFASRLRNIDRRYINHKTVAENLSKKLGLEMCFNTLTIKCSGGQRKRLSIALELVSRVDVLILDEPTTGLDTSSSTKTIKALLSLTKQRRPIATVATIHQPSGKLFKLFDKIYVLSNAGQCIYDGPPNELNQTLSLIGLMVPTFYNPADFILEVASGDYAKQSIHLLSHYNREYNKNRFQSQKSSSLTVIDAAKAEFQQRPRAFLKQLWILLTRILITTYRDPSLSILRIFIIFPTSFLIGWIFNSDIGKASGCPPSKLMLWKLNVNHLVDEFEEQRFQLQENLSLLFLTMMMAMFSSQSALIMTFPSEMNVFAKEYRNHSYSIFAYYLSKVLADMPFCLASGIGITTIPYFMTGQIMDTYLRLFYLNLVNVLISISGQSIGLIFGAAFMEDENAAMYASGIVILPLFIFAGFFRKLSLIPKYLLPLSYISYYRYSLSALLITMFGLNRCEYEHRLAEQELNASNLTRPQWLKTMSVLFDFQNFMGDGDKDLDDSMERPQREPEDNMMLMFGGESAVTNGSTVSLILSQFDIDGSEQSFWHELRILSFFVFFMNISIYFILNYKVNRKR